MTEFFRKKIPLYIVLLLVTAITVAISYFFLKKAPQKENIVEKKPAEIELIRNTQYEFIKPLMMIETPEEDPSFATLKNMLENYYSAEKGNGSIQSVSVYLRDLNYGKWMSINPNEEYSPGSMLKIITLISMLKDSEKDKSVLERRVFFEKHFSELPSQTIVASPLQPGKDYSIRELLEKMIIDSDNDATALLGTQTNFTTYFAFLQEIQFTLPELGQKDYPITASKYSRLFRVLFNSSYLNQQNSEYALNLLSQSKFKEGIAKYIPKNTKVAHKFGERFIGADLQWHESGIVYLKDRPFLLTVMSRGADQNKLKEILSTTGQTVFDFMKNR
ncbi:MAG: serine hydrolase [Bacteroidia bacterium]